MSYQQTRAENPEPSRICLCRVSAGGHRAPFDYSVLTGRSDLSVERNRVDSITTSNEFDTPFHYEDVAICWAFSLDSLSFSLPFYPHLTRTRSLSYRRLVPPARFRRVVDSLFIPLLGPLSGFVSVAPGLLFLARSPGPEVVMSDSVARLVASCESHRARRTMTLLWKHHGWLSRSLAVAVSRISQRDRAMVVGWTA